MVQRSDNVTPNIEHLHGTAQPALVSDELARLTSMLKPFCPGDSIVRFEYDGTLRLHLDVRRYEDLAAMESLLPTLCGGVFHDVRRGMSEHHSFFHRLTASVAR